MRRLVLAAAVLAASVSAACGGGGSSPPVPSVAPARSFALADVTPRAAVPPARPTAVGFTVLQPDGRPLTRYRQGSGPHTGVHLILVRDDLSTLIHRHPPIAADGHVAQELALPEPGTYRMVVDAYPNLPDQPPNLQLHADLRASGIVDRRRLPPFAPVVRTGGLTFRMTTRPALRALQPAFLAVRVTNAGRRPVRFTPYYGATAHAIFFRAGSLDYFHTHVCAPDQAACTGTAGAAAGRSTKSGELNVGVLLPAAGTWRLFLQVEVAGRVLTAPYTLTVR